VPFLHPLTFLIWLVVSPLGAKNPFFDHWTTEQKKRRPAGKKTSHTFVYSQCATYDPHQTRLGTLIGQCHFCIPLNSLDLINSFAIRGYWKFVGKCPHQRKMLITWLSVPKSNQIKNIKATYRCVWILRILWKSCPWGAHLCAKIQFWWFQEIFLHISANKCEIWWGRADLRSAPPVPNFTFFLCNMSCGAKKHFWTTE